MEWTTWMLGMLSRLLPWAGRSFLALRNLYRGKRDQSDDRFRFVLCWLDNDRRGENTDVVAQAFISIPGVTLVRSARVVKASGAADEWRTTMQSSAHAVLERWHGDLALVGLVKKPGEALSLWFIPRVGDGTLERGDRPYTLENVTLREDFHHDLHAQLTALALAAVAPLSQTELRARVLEEGLSEASRKLTTLIDGYPPDKRDRRGDLYFALGNALQVLGERAGGTKRLEEAVVAYRMVLQEGPRDSGPFSWARTQNNLGTALLTLGERAGGAERLEEAVKAHRAALEVRTRERVPLDWAASQNNLGVALQALGERAGSTELLEQAVEAYRAALELRTREHVPLDWAMTQNNLGVALHALGKREGGAERLEQAVEAYRAALEESTRERVPLDWAGTKSNLGNVLCTLGEQTGRTERLEEAVCAHRAALKERTRERVPLDWAGTKSNLGNVLCTLGEQTGRTERLEKAVCAHRAALEEYTREHMPFEWARTQNNLGDALQALGKRESGTERLESLLSRRALRTARRGRSRTRRRA